MSSEKIKFLTLLIAFIPSILTTTWVFITSFPSPLITNKSISEINILPQGWAFFTKSPRDIRTEVFDYEKQKFISLKNFSLQNVFGIKRTSTRLSIEIASLIKEAPDSLWVESYRLHENTFLDGEFIKKKSAFLYPKLSGKIILINKERVPWAWSSFEEKIQKSVNYLKVHQYAN